MSCEKSNASSNRVAVIVGFQSSLHRNFCNACVKETSVIRQYTGALLGHCETVEIVEGCWPKNYGLGVLVFDQGRECAKWTVSDPVFRAQDFLEQVEMYCVPLNVPAPADHPVLSIMDLDVRSGDAICSEVMSRHEEGVRAAGGIPCVASTCQVHKVRGLRAPGYFLIDAWRSREDFEAWYNSEGQAAEREARQQSAPGDVILACLSRIV